mmetsp:Transcript_60709/g.185425  ORF Transcript_60709/g.185425 Transcript_60709/m.185425 type:complete len:410 (+) Transcript_60709:1092-2321(+)
MTRRARSTNATAAALQAMYGVSVGRSPIIARPSDKASMATRYASSTKVSVAMKATCLVICDGKVLLKCSSWNHVWNSASSSGKPWNSTHLPKAGASNTSSRPCSIFVASAGGIAPWSLASVGMRGRGDSVESKLSMRARPMRVRVISVAERRHHRRLLASMQAWATLIVAARGSEGCDVGDFHVNLWKLPGAGCASSHVATWPLPFMGTSPQYWSFLQLGNIARVASPSCARPRRAVCIMRAVVLMVSPKSLNRGNLWPTQPATMGPVWMPILNSTWRSLPWMGWKCCRRSMSSATRSRRSRITAWPNSCATRLSSGTTPTAHTYSAPIVSIFVTPCLAQIASNSQKQSLRKVTSMSGVISRAMSSKSSMVTKSNEAVSQRSARGLPGSRSTGSTSAGGSINAKIRKRS